jgi:hypothetical protein
MPRYHHHQEQVTKRVRFVPGHETYEVERYIDFVERYPKKRDEYGGDWRLRVTALRAESIEYWEVLDELYDDGSKASQDTADSL